MTGLIGYARVSTREQSTDAQLDRLTAAGCEKIFHDDGVSGRLAKRPQWDRCLDHLRAGDVLVVTKLDRIGRSLANLLEVINDLGQRGVDLRVLDQAIDTTTPGGRLVFHVMAAVAEFEVDLLRERTRDGLAAARANDRFGGRPPKLTGPQHRAIRSMYQSGEYTIAAIAAAFSVSQMTIYRSLHVTLEETA